jgi:uncharacterized protein YbdZ (MbtH family)
LVSEDWYLNAVHFTSPDEGWAVGRNSTNRRGVLLYYVKETWIPVTPPSVSSNWYLNAVHFTSANEGWAVGRDDSNDREVLLHYLSGTWTQVTPTVTSTGWNLNGIYFISPDEGWAVGDDWSSMMGVFLHYSNGSWTPVTFPGSMYYSYSYPFAYLSAVGFTSPDAGWAVGGSDNDGNNLFQFREGRWIRVKKPSHGPDYLNSIHFPTPNEAWAVGSGKDNVLLHYYGGVWTSVKLLDLNKTGSPFNSWRYFTGVHFASPYEGWVVGEDWYTGQGILIKYSAPGFYVGKDGLCGGKTTCYTSIQTGIDSAQSYATIAIDQEEYSEEVILDEPKVLTLKGGWDTDFLSNSSYTVINGSVTIADGTLIPEYIIVR